MCQYIYFRLRLTLYKWVFSASFQQSRQIQRWTTSNFLPQARLTPFDKIWYGDHVLLLLLNESLSPKVYFLSRTSLNIFSGLVYPKTKKQESSEFWPTAWANPFLGKNKQMWRLLKINTFICLKWLLFYLEHPEMLKDLFPVSVSSLNFSSAGTSWGKRGSGVRDVALLSLGNLGAKFSEMSFPHFKTYFTQICRCHL